VLSIVFGSRFSCHSKNIRRLKSVVFCVKKNREDRNISDVSGKAVTAIFRKICKDFTIIIMTKDGYI